MMAVAEARIFMETNEVSRCLSSKVETFLRELNIVDVRLVIVRLVKSVNAGPKILSAVGKLERIQLLIYNLLVLVLQLLEVTVLLNC